MRLTLLFAVLFPFCALAQNPYWEQLAGPYGGPVETLAQLPDGTLLAGQGLGGIWRSTDGGASWTRTSTDNRLGNFPSLFPYDASTVFAGCFSGLFRSDDAGRSWQRLKAGFPVWTLAMASVEQLYAGSVGSAYRSLDGGSTWDDLHPADNSTSVFRLVRDNGGMLFAGSYRHGLQRSSNDGNSWELISDRLPSHQVWTVHMFHGRDLYVSTSEGVFLSTNGGYTWTDRSTGLDSSTVTFITLHGSTLYALSSDDAIFSADESGGSWSTLPGPDRGSIFTLHVSDEAIWAGTEQGLYSSTDGGANWAASHEGMYQPAVNAVTGSRNGGYWAATDRGGAYRSFDGGDHWELMTADIGNGMELRSITSWGQHVFAAGYETSLLHTGDAGLSWEQVSLPGDPLIISVQLTPTSHYPTAVYAGGTQGEVFRSTKEGNGWTPLTTIDNGGQPVSVEQLQASAGVIYAGTSLGVFRSTDDGASWINACQALDREIIRVLAVDPGTATVFAGDYSDLYRSTDAGETWELMYHHDGQGFLQACVALRKLVYLATTDGLVLESRDRGVTWTDQSPGWPGATVLTLAFEESDFLLAGTENSGVIRNAMSLDAGGVKHPAGFTLSQNYPNPFGPGTGHPITHIRFSLPRAGMVSISVHDALGREVFRSDLGLIPAGSHEYALRVPGAKPGVYFYTLGSAAGTSTRSMIIH